jgi:hypothetical protein
MPSISPQPRPVVGWCSAAGTQIIPLSAARRGLDVVSLSFPWLGLVHSWNLGRAPSRAGRTVIIENRMGRGILGFVGGHRRAGRNETLASFVLFHD